MKWFLSHSLSPRNKLVGGELTINSLILPSKVTKIIISDTSLQVKRPTFITCLYYLSLCKLIHIAHIYTYLSTRTTVFVCLKITQIEVHNSLFEVFFFHCAYLLINWDLIALWKDWSVGQKMWIIYVWWFLHFD